MNFLDTLIALLFHLNTFLTGFITQYGVFVYLLVFVVIFCETGLFVAFLPGDSLIFACAAFSAVGLLNIWIVIIICFSSAFIGDGLNFYLGHSIGRKIYESAGNRFIKRANIDKAKSFYDKHGGKAIVLSRFIPIVRQLTPFVAGIGKMSYERFMSYNLIGVVAWVGVAASAGYFLGNVPIVSSNFTIVTLLIIFVSLLPAIITYFRAVVIKKR